MKKTTWLMLVLLFISGCSYTPSDEDIVDTHSEITNVEKFRAFIKNVNEGQKDEIRVVRYTIEGDPMLHDLKYDGKQISSTTDSTRDEFGSGEISTATCQSIDVIETSAGTEYRLAGCDQTDRDNSILIISK